MVSMRLFFLISSLLISCCGQRVVNVTAPFDLADGAFWDPRTSALYFVDIHKNSVLRFDPRTGNASKITLPTTEGVYFVLPTSNRPDQFVVNLGKDLNILTWDGTDGAVPVLRNITSVDQQNVVFTDGKSDVVGRVWAGTVDDNVAPDRGVLYSLDPNSTKLAKKLSPVTLSSGLAWNLENTILYYNDGRTYEISAFDYDPATGSIRNRSVVFSFAANNVPGFPDRMTIDSEDNLWVACYGGSQVIRVNPRTGQLLQRIELPASQVTSVAFGGSTLDVLYVSTARANLTETQLKQQPLAGSIFRVDGIGATGVPSHTAVREV